MRLFFSQLLLFHQQPIYVLKPKMVTIAEAIGRQAPGAEFNKPTAAGAH